MPQITELFDSFPHDENVRKIVRDEDGLFTVPQFQGPIKLLQHENIGKVHFPVIFEPSKFAPPMGVYESQFLRLEWQKMNFRQPFYHRNADVDEMSYQVYGGRTLMTEQGSVDLRPGDFSRIPVGAAHDNCGREEIHLLFYVHPEITDCGPVDRTATFALPPYEGWESKQVAEVLTNCLGGPECDIAASMNDETLILKHAEGLCSADLMPVLRAPEDAQGTTWMYKGSDVWIGLARGEAADGAASSERTYRRHRCCEEIQCQIKGSRTVVSQRGIIKLAPGDFVSIPVGVAFTEIVHEKSEHVVVLTARPAPNKAPLVGKAEDSTVERVRQLFP
ncbi:uncharacterized protein M421DRAFT_426393 [Didymella exigua CBS 183.55]|uniref:RmlC-like cupin n=1 Tax=Didymella exigua CBS 183.55 TaxID=1150837 RepID=A0A6A5R6T1_9PLEO|nr:uncharacterized protein M421DRAFT_426393 [Didymella exigua CBS 183.55]KAF1922898.1 hypothetical protein M421DRAFT_426393 [Didymella exigua CBS 183.55]